MLGCCSQIQDRIGRERCNLIRDSSKLSITSYFNNMKPAKHIHLVYLVHCGPNFTHFMIDKMSDCGKANPPAVHHKEDMPIDKENINTNADLLLELQ
jgi:hypothetical protein